MRFWKPVFAVTLAVSAMQARAAEQLPLLPGGVVFPEYNSAGLGNPGTLNREDTRLARVLITPNIFGSVTQALDLDYTYTDSKWGLDLGYDVSRYVFPGTSFLNSLTHVFHGALGYRIDALGLGVAYVQPIGQYSTPDFKAGLAYTMGHSRLGIVLDSLNSAPQATLGFGVRDDSNYLIEFNLGLPSFAAGLTTGGSTYTMTLATSLYLNDFGVGYVTTHPLVVPGGVTGQPGIFDTPFSLTHAFTLLYKFTKTGSASLRFDAAGSVTFGFTFRL